MFFHKKINSDIFLLVLLVVRLRIDSDLLNSRPVRSPESREVFLGSTSAYTQITIHSRYPNVQYPHPKSLDLNEEDEAAILFNRLNYYNSVRERRSNLIAYYSSSSDVQNSATPNESPPSSPTDRVENATASGESSLPMSDASLDSSSGTPSDDETRNLIIHDLTPEDMDLIEILWKQDIDLGVSREAFDPRSTFEVEKLKEAEYTKEIPQDFFVPCESKPCEEVKIKEEPYSGGNFTIDSETGEFILDEFTALIKEEIPESELLESEPFHPLNQDSAQFLDNEPFLSLNQDARHPLENEQFHTLNHDSRHLLENERIYALNQDSRLLLENEQFHALNQDSYLPFNNDDEAQLSNLTDVFSPGEFPELMPENYTDSEYILSQIEDLGKELESYIGNDPESESLYSQPGDGFPTMEDCWPDSSAMLPLLALGSSHQSPFASLASRPDYINNNVLRPLSSDFVSRQNEGFSSILHSSSTIETSATEETFHSIPVSIGPSSIGCALAESISTLHNDSDPIPSGSLINTVYVPQMPDVMYSNQSLTAPHNELLIHDLFTDEDFQLGSMPSELNSRISRTDHIDNSNDSASLASGRVPSVSDCPDWVDSCSESSSHNGEHQYSVPHTRGSFYVQNTELYPSSLPPKRHKPLKNSEADVQDFSGAAFEHSNGSGGQYISVKSEYSDIYESHTPRYAGCSESTYKKFDYTKVRSVGNDILQHNHSYHLPFASDDSHYKPVLRDKKTLSEEEARSKDEKKATELNLPISIDDIINLAIDEYNERLAKYELTDQQLNLIRDIRRRGKNKVAAQNCRKRKMDQINSLQQDLDSMQNEKLQLKSKQEHLLQDKHQIEDKYAQLYQIVSQFTNNKPPGAALSVHNNDSMTFPAVSDIMSDDDSDLSRGARTKRKFKK